MFFILILLDIFDSNFLLHFILLVGFMIQITISFIKFKSLLYIASSFLPLVIHPPSVFSAPITMVPYHRQRGWLLPFVLYFCFLVVDEFNHSLISLTTWVSTFMGDRIITIYNYFICDHYQLNNVVSHYLMILFQRNGAVSPSPWFIAVFVIFIFPHCKWVRPLRVLHEIMIHSDNVIA